MIATDNGARRRRLSLLIAVVLLGLGGTVGQDSGLDSVPEETTTTTERSGWPIHHRPEKEDDDAAAVVYQEFMRGCYKQDETSNSDGERRLNQRTLCDRRESERLTLNRNQPPLMSNFTTLGYAKVPIPKAALDILQRFWNHDNDEAATRAASSFDSTTKAQQQLLQRHQLRRLRREQWESGSVYTNHWSSPTHMLNVNNNLPLSQLRRIEREVQQVLEQWSGVSLVPTSTYGIRVYGKGSVLAPHVDRLPLVLSAILHVDHDKEDDNADAVRREEWPLQLIGHDGVAVNMTLQPGEMILYESHSVIHGRPYPYQGHYYANLFCHYEPIGYTFNWKQQQQKQSAAQLLPDNDKDNQNAAQLFDYLLHHQDQMPKHQHPVAAPTQLDIRLPPYRLQDDEEVRRWKQEYQFIRQSPPKERKVAKTPGSTNAHTLAALGDLSSFRAAVERNPALADQPDGNGWKPLHEAARAGHVKVLEFLIVEQGVNVNERTNKGEGATALWWALQHFPDHHPAVKLLKKHGARSLAPLGAP